MYTDIALKLKALTLAVMINAVIMGGAGYLFNGQLRQHSHDSLLASGQNHHGSGARIGMFRP